MTVVLGGCRCISAYHSISVYCVRVPRETEARLVHSLDSCVPPHCIRCELAQTVHWAHLPSHTLLGKHLLAYKVEGVRLSVLPFRVGVLCPLGNLLNASPQACHAVLVICLGQVRNSSPPWFGGEGASSLRTPNCRRALGLLLLDWSSKCSTTSLVLSGPDGRPGLSRELLVVVRAGQINRTKCTKTQPGDRPPCLPCVYVCLRVCVSVRMLLYVHVCL